MQTGLRLLMILKNMPHTVKNEIINKLNESYKHCDDRKMYWHVVKRLVCLCLGVDETSMAFARFHQNVSGWHLQYRAL